MNEDLNGFEFEVEDPERLGKRATARVVPSDTDGQYVALKLTCHEDGAIFHSCRTAAAVRALKESSEKAEKANPPASCDQCGTKAWCHLTCAEA